MAKPLVLRADEDVRVPFLRGILTRSLQESGLSFEDAYRLASEVRGAVREAAEISTEDLRELVAERLERFGEDVVRRYRTRRAAPPPIIVRHPDGHGAPFSRGRQRLALAPSGISGEDAVRVVDRLLERFATNGVREVTTQDLGLLIYEFLKDAAGEEAARRFVVWEEYLQSDVPLLVLIGGATGTGKSTVAAEISNRLEIVRTQSTDMLREVMRTMVSDRLLPVLHASSFLAWEMLPQHANGADSGEGALADGYLAQVELLSVACDAVLRRATKERVSMIIEGVHVCPSMVERIPETEEAILVPVMLGVLKPKRLRQQIKGRGQRVPARRAKRYLQSFDAIWGLQTFLLSEADRAGIPIVAGVEVEEVVQEVMGIVLTELSRHFSGKAAQVFR